MSSAVCFNLDQFNILSSGNGLKEVTSFKKKYVFCQYHDDTSSVNDTVFYPCLKLKRANYRSHDAIIFQMASRTRDICTCIEGENIHRFTSPSLHVRTTI